MTTSAGQRDTAMQPIFSSSHLHHFDKQKVRDLTGDYAVLERNSRRNIAAINLYLTSQGLRRNRKKWPLHIPQQQGTLDDQEQAMAAAARHRDLLMLVSTQPIRLATCSRC